MVDGHYFEVMGLRPVLGRLLTTVRRWAECGGRDRADVSILDRIAALRPQRDRQDGAAGELEGARSATIVGVLEPSVPYPVATEIIANVVTSPHHLSATMVTGREHRMTEVFARLAPGATLDARAIGAAHAVRRDHGRTSRRSTSPRITTESMRRGCTTRSIRAPTRFCGCCLRPRDCCL